MTGSSSGEQFPEIAASISASSRRHGHLRAADAGSAISRWDGDKLVTMPSLFTAVTDTTVPTTAPGSTSGSNGAFAGGVGEVIRGIIDNLGHNGYQTGVAIVFATIAVVAMLNIKAPRWVIAPVAIGAFWAGWLGWNTLSGQDNPLFPGDVSATKIWDVALAGDRGFLIVVTWRVSPRSSSGAAAPHSPAG